MRVLVPVGLLLCLFGSIAGCTSEEPGSGPGGVVCEGDNCTCEATTCNTHGTCVVTAQSALCICDTGYGNSACDGCAFGYARVEGTGDCAPRLSRTLPENAGSNCGSGGVALLTGLDLDGNGNLDPSEVDETVYVCAATGVGGSGGTGTSGEGGTGGVSGNGGTAGTDDDDAGVSGAGGAGNNGGNGGSGGAPVTCVADQCGDHGTCMETFNGPRCYCETAYMGNACELCASGYSRSPTRGCVVPNTITSTEPVPAGTQCQHGGTRIRSGQDLNDNNTLEDNEATYNSFSCNTPLIRTGDVTVTNRAGLEDLRGVTEITGNLTINASQIEDVSSLLSLTRVGGNLWIEGTSGLRDLSGLDALTSIGGTLYIGFSTALVTLDAFPSLRGVTGNITIANNTTLVSVAGFDSLVAAGSFRVSANPLLTSVVGPSAVEVGGITISSNPALTSVTGFDEVTAARGVVVESNGGLTTLDAFHALTWIRGRLRIAANGTLTEIDAFENLVTLDQACTCTVSGQFFSYPPCMFGLTLSCTGDPPEIIITDNPSLRTISDLPDLQACSLIRISHNPVLGALPTIGQALTLNTLELRENDTITNLAGLENITRINTLAIERNDAMTALTGYSGSAGNVTIRTNPLLPQCEALAFRTATGATSNVSQISGNDDTATCN